MAYSNWLRGEVEEEDGTFRVLRGGRCVGVFARTWWTLRAGMDGTVDGKVWRIRGDGEVVWLFCVDPVDIFGEYGLLFEDMFGGEYEKSGSPVC